MEGEEGIKKPRNQRRRRRPGTKALQEIKFYQQSVKRIIPKAVIKRIIRQNIDGRRIRQSAFDAIHACVEEYATSIFKGTQMLAIHANRKTIQPKDMRNAQRVALVMNGGTDMEPEPVNPEMSKAHAKYTKKKRAPAKKKNGPPPLVPANLEAEIEVEDLVFDDKVVAVVVEASNEPSSAREHPSLDEVADDDWFGD